jgi:hypothetical protein
VREEMRETGRTNFGIAKRVYITVDDDEDRARSRMAEALDRL